MFATNLADTQAATDAAAAAAAAGAAAVVVEAVREAEANAARTAERTAAASEERFAAAAAALDQRLITSPWTNARFTLERRRPDPADASIPRMPALAVDLARSGSSVADIEVGPGIGLLLARHLLSPTSCRCDLKRHQLCLTG